MNSTRITFPLGKAVSTERGGVAFKNRDATVAPPLSVFVVTQADPHEKRLREQAEGSFHKASAVLGESVHRLLKNRDFLALQLDLAYENVSEDEFEEVVEEEGYLLEPKLQDENELREKVRILTSALPCRISSPDVALIFSCPLDQADRVLEQVSSDLLQEWKMANG